MITTERFADADGNSIVITTASDGMTVSASISTKPPYTGGADAGAARLYVRKHGLKLR